MQTFGILGDIPFRKEFKITEKDVQNNFPGTNIE